MNEENICITRAIAGDFNDVLKLYYEFLREVKEQAGLEAPHPRGIR